MHTLSDALQNGNIHFFRLLTLLSSARHKPLHDAGQTTDFLYKPVSDNTHKEYPEAQSHVLDKLRPRLMKDDPGRQGDEEDDARQDIEDSASETREEDADPLDEHDRQQDGKEGNFQK